MSVTVFARAAAGALAALALAACKPSPPASPPPTPVPTPSPSPSPSATPSPKPPSTPVIPRKPMDTAQLFNGIAFSQKLSAPRSDKLASQERTNPKSYVAEIKISVERPRASSTMEDFRSNDESLAAFLSGIPGFPENAKVSPAFDKLYDLKESWLRARLSRLDQLLSRHNYYDCETILDFQSEGGRRALVLKGDMDVNTDGSDGDRNMEIDGSSPYFQPQTSYRWRRRTERPNPFLEKTEKRLTELKTEYAVKGLSAARNAELREGIETLTRRLYDLKTWSFLISAADPAVVLPGFMLRGEEGRPADAAIGDYAVAVYQGKAYPAIVGDAGPSFKFGEGTLRLCKELNSRSSALARPVSDLQVAYIVFPGTAEEAGPPDLERWHDRCAELLTEIGLKDAPLHRWENIVPPWPTPTPSPTPEPSPSPEFSPPAAPLSAPEASPSPSAVESPAPSPVEFAAPTSSPASPEASPVPAASPAMSPAPL